MPTLDTGDEEAAGVELAVDPGPRDGQGLIMATEAYGMRGQQRGGPRRVRVARGQRRCPRGWRPDAVGGQGSRHPRTPTRQRPPLALEADGPARHDLAAQPQRVVEHGDSQRPHAATRGEEHRRRRVGHGGSLRLGTPR